MVGLVIVSHSAALAAGVVELARQMGGEEVRIEAAGGMEDGSIGTDAERVRAAIERAMSDDGVLVLMDLGSALLSAEMAVELMDGDGRVELSEAPLVEGAVAAAASARGGASLEEVRSEAAAALGMKAAQLGITDHGSRITEEVPSAVDAAATVPILNEIGLHARPAALVVELAGSFDADLRLAKPGGNPVSAKSLTGLMTLSARKGDELEATAAGPQASEAIEALEELAKGGFGEGVTTAPRAKAPDTRHPTPETPSAGTTLRGIPASAGLAIGPARLLRSASGPPAPRESEGSEAELKRLDEALATAREAIERDRQAMAGRAGASEAAIFTAHLALLDDEGLLAPARAAIEGGAAAEGAWYAATQDAAAVARALDDPLLQARAIDIEDAGRRVIAAIAGDAGGGRQRRGVVIAGKLTPRRRRARRGAGARHRHGTRHRHRARGDPLRGCSGCPPWWASASRCWRSRRAPSCCSTAARASCSSGRARSRCARHASVPSTRRCAARKRSSIRTSRRRPRTAPASRWRRTWAEPAARRPRWSSARRASACCVPSSSSSTAPSCRRRRSRPETIAQIARELDGRPLVVRARSTWVPTSRCRRSRWSPRPTRSSGCAACASASPSCSPASSARSCAWRWSTRCG